MLRTWHGKIIGRWIGIPRHWTTASIRLYQKLSLHYTLDIICRYRSIHTGVV